MTFPDQFAQNEGMETVVLDHAEAEGSTPAVSVAEVVVKSERRIPPQLRPYLFQPGHAPSGGRPKGSRNRITPQEIFKRKELRIAKHYTDRAFKSDQVLIDAVKRILPVNETQSASTQVVIFVGDSNLLPRALDTISVDTPSGGILPPSMPGSQSIDGERDAQRRENQDNVV